MGCDTVIWAFDLWKQVNRPKIMNTFGNIDFSDDENFSIRLHFRIINL